MLNVVVFYCALFALVVYAYMRGGAPERWTAGVLTTSALFDTLIVNLAQSVFQSREPGILALDVITLAAVTVIALRAERIWPMIMAAFLLVGVELQVGIWIAPAMHRQVYKLAHAYSAYPVMIILLAGIMRHDRRTHRHLEQDWTQFKKDG